MFQIVKKKNNINAKTVLIYLGRKQQHHTKTYLHHRREILPDTIHPLPKTTKSPKVHPHPLTLSPGDRKTPIARILTQNITYLPRLPQPSRQSRIPHHQDNNP